jgi:Zn-finger nucleic acid-binding protein
MDQAVIDEKHSAHFCGKCRGILLPRDTFAGLINHRRAWATGVAVSPPPFDRRTLNRVLNGPLCAGRFNTHPYGGPGAVAIDTCDRCNVVWLDYRELNQIVAAPGRDRGSREMPPQDDSYAIVPLPTEEDVDRRGDPLDFILTLLS